MSFTVTDLRAGYGRVQVLHGVSLTVPPGQIIALIGPNGAGKSTLLRAATGMIRATGGSVRLGDRDVTRAATEAIARAGVAHVPEGRRLFVGLTVRDNLRLGGLRATTDKLDAVLTMFPRLRERLDQVAGSLSGGEQQMCAIGRALMSRPKLLLMDEPSAGLAPLVVAQVFDLVRKVRADGLTVLIVEQNVQQVLRVVDRAYLIEAGSIRASGSSAEMLASDTVKEAYLGV